jgi:hypothetical protein
MIKPSIETETALLLRHVLAEHFQEELSHRCLVFAVSALFGSVLRVGKAVPGVAIDFQLPVDLGGAQLPDQCVDLRQRGDLVGHAGTAMG